jgi:D-aminopeptidase
MRRCRLRDLRISLGRLPPGPENAITGAAGVEVGYATVMADQPRVVRTGVTAIWPARDVWQRPMFAGFHSFNRNGELTGAHWLAEQGGHCDHQSRVGVKKTEGPEL